MKKLIFAAAALLCFGAQAKKTIVSGVTNASGSTLVRLSPTGEAGEWIESPEGKYSFEEYDGWIESEDREFRFELDCEKPLRPRLSVPNVDYAETMLMVFPGDSLYVIINVRPTEQEDFMPLSFSGDGAKRNRDLYGWFAYSGEEIFEVVSAVDDSVSSMPPAEQMRAFLGFLRDGVPSIRNDMTIFTLAKKLIEVDPAGFDEVREEVREMLNEPSLYQELVEIRGL